MKDDRGGRAEEIFQEALDRPPDERESYVAEACGDDPALRAEVDSLLGHFEAAGSRYLDPRQPAVEEVPPPSLGPYRATKLLGEGGMGRVWLAEQKEPIERLVALKVLRWGAADPQLARRFVEERRLLARMRHPNVAQIHDAGTADDGAPYLAMEYVDGATITAYCDERTHSVRQRLELFLDVCAGVAHAHQQGVIHRDLKPSNVLVAETEGGPTPKVIDFGIAKELETSATGLTRAGHLLGTPEYMSPEQIRGGDVDTRTDVHALGLLLYELLVGRLPFADRPGQQSPVEYIQRSSTGDSPRPSERISASDPDTEEIARRRGSDLRALRRVLRGDLDWILLKALARDPDDRYSSASDFADDVRRHLRREPIVARPPSAIYVARRFAQRHPAGAAAFLSIVLALVAITGLTLRHSQRLEVEREAARRAEAEARRQAAIAEATTEFLTEDLLAAAAPEAKGRDVKVVEVLDSASELVEERFPDDPLTRAAIHQTMTRTYARLGDTDSALPHAERALEILREELGDDARTAVAMNQLGSVVALDGDLDRGSTLLADAFEDLRRTAGPDDERTIRCQRELASTLEWLGRHDEVDTLTADGVVRARRALGPLHPETLNLVNNRGLILSRLGRLDEAEEYLLEALSGYEELHGKGSADALVAGMNLGALYYRQGRFDDAARRFEELLPPTRSVFGEAHPRTLGLINNLAATYRRTGEVERSIPLFEEVLDVRTELLGPDHRNTLITGNNLARAYFQVDRFEDARRTVERVAEGRRKTLGIEHTDTLNAIKFLAGVQARLGLFDEAFTLVDGLLQYEEAYAEGDPRGLGQTLSLRGDLLRRRGSRPEAEESLRAAQRYFDEASDVTAEERDLLAERFVTLYEEWGREQEAAEWRERRESAAAPLE